MADIKNPCPDRRKATPLQIVSMILGPIITIGLFIILYAVINPRAEASEKLNIHQTKIEVIEKKSEATDRVIEKLDEKIEKVDGKVDKILDILIRGNR